MQRQMDRAQTKTGANQTLLTNRASVEKGGQQYNSDGGNSEDSDLRCGFRLKPELVEFTRVRHKNFRPNRLARLARGRVIPSIRECMFKLGSLG